MFLDQIGGLTGKLDKAIIKRRNQNQQLQKEKKKKELNVHMLVGEGKKVKLNNLCYQK